MIVTRQRPKRIPWGRIILPVLAIGALIAALMWPPSHKVIFEGPLAPALSAIGNASGTALRPLTFVAQNQTIADRNRQLKVVSDQLEAERKQVAQRDGDLQQLRAQVAELQQGSSAATPVPAGPPLKNRPAANSPRTAAGVPGTAANVGGTTTAPVPAANDTTLRRTAAQWAAMDAAEAAAIVQRLPLPYVAQVFAKMSPDDAGPILAALPPTLAAKITQATPP